MTRLTFALALLIAAPAGAETILTAHPAAHALARRLTEGTAIEVRAVQPERLPASRLASFLHGRGRADFEAAAREADAVLTFGSFWPDDPLFPAARRANIRIVQIDAAQPLDQRMAGIALLDPRASDAEIYALLDLQPMPPQGEETAPWMSLTSLAEMAEVVAGDLGRLVPDAAPGITGNLAGLKHELLATKAKADADLADAESVEVVALSPQFGYFAADLGLDLRATIIAAPREWTSERAARLVGWLETEGIGTVLTGRELTGELASALDAGGIRVITLETLPQGDPAQAVAANLALLGGE
ncbi:metal ABC transporter solute-binding protein, Zn/Mn family [Paracoccus sp. KR1-242]|uniref:metal ABC transporter solute-binding protein, Zn/Mn family n=1 Tax=Paracoccus sp. KR1-242 TaxID=3410028 RepID=UPI003C020E4F